MTELSHEERDSLKRKKIAEKLRERIMSADTDSVISDAHGTILLDGSYGTGKTFVMEWTAELIRKNQEGHSPPRVVYFDAWKHEDAIDPMIPMLAALIPKNTLKELEAFLPVLTSLLPASIRAPIDALHEAMHKEKSIKEFQDQLASSIKSSNGGFPSLVVLVDELDRCRPDFALSLLERIKHLFSVKGVVFVLAADIKAMQEMTKKTYGITDPLSYLLKFFDERISLPKPDRNSFLGRLEEPLPHDERASEHALPTFILFSEIFNLSLRKIKRGYKEISRPEIERFECFEFAQTAGMLVALRLHDQPFLEEICDIDHHAALERFSELIISRIVEAQRYALAKKMDDDINCIDRIPLIFGVAKKIPPSSQFATLQPRFYTSPTRADKLDYTESAKQMITSFREQRIVGPTQGNSILQFVSRRLGYTT